MVSTICSMAYLSRMNFMRGCENCRGSMFTWMILRKMLSVRLKCFSSVREMRNERSLCGKPGTSVSSTANKALPAGRFHMVLSITTSTS